MSHTIKAAFIVAIVITAISALLNYTPEGIIILDGYAHGVVICGDEMGDDQRVEQEDEFVMYLHDGNTVTINWGHTNDPEVAELLTLASTTCDALVKKYTSTHN